MAVVANAAAPVDTLLLGTTPKVNPPVLLLPWETIGEGVNTAVAPAAGPTPNTIPPGDPDPNTGAPTIEDEAGARKINPPDDPGKHSGIVEVDVDENNDDDDADACVDGCTPNENAEGTAWGPLVLVPHNDEDTTGNTDDVDVDADAGVPSDIAVCIVDDDEDIDADEGDELAL